MSSNRNVMVAGGNKGIGAGIEVKISSAGYKVVATFNSQEPTKAPEIREKIEASIPLGRFSPPEEVSGLVAYMLSDEASYISGANFNISGALHLA